MSPDAFATSQDRILAVIPVHNRRDTTLSILASVRSLRTTNFRLDTLIIDDGSSDSTAEAVAARFPDTAIVRGDGNLWWGGALNVGFRYGLSHGYDFIYTLNDDIVLRDDTLEELHRAAVEMPQVVLASVVLREDRRVHKAGFVYRGLLRKLHSPYKGSDYASLGQNILLCETLSTQSTIIPAEVFRKGFFVDEQRFPHNYSDLDFFDRVRRGGFRLAVVRNSVVQAAPSSSNFHLFITSKNVVQILRSFFSIKYAHNLRTQWNIAFRDSDPLLGVVRFTCNMLPYCWWLALRIVLPMQTLTRLLVSQGRMAPLQPDDAIDRPSKG